MHNKSFQKEGTFWFQIKSSLLGRSSLGQVAPINRVGTSRPSKSLAEISSLFDCRGSLIRGGSNSRWKETLEFAVVCKI